MALLDRVKAMAGAVEEGCKGHGASRSAPDEGSLIEALRSVHDPEIPVNIYDLGLIYRLHWDSRGRVEIDMTLTAPGCPVAGSLPRQVEAAVRRVPGVSEAAVRLVWDPPWSRERMAEEARLQLGLM